MPFLVLVFLSIMSSSSLENKIPYSILFTGEHLFHIVSLFLAVFCTGHVSRDGQAFDKSHQMSLPKIFSSSKRVSILFSWTLGTERYYTSTSLTFFEETPFFPSCTQEVDFVQQVFLIPLVEPLGFHAHDTLNQTNIPISSPSPSPPS